MGLPLTHLTDVKAKADHNTNMYVYKYTVRTRPCSKRLTCCGRQNSGPPRMPVPESLKSVTTFGYMAKGNSGCRWK